VLQDIADLNARYGAEIKRYQELEEMAAKAAAARERESSGVMESN